jgi:DNA-binding CsgD family transcriptional regulator
MFVPGSTQSVVAEMLDEGLSVAEIGRRTGLADNTVRYHRRRIAGSRTPRAPTVATAASRESDARSAKRRPRLAVTTREKVRQLLGAGYSRLEAARRLGLSKSTVSYHARRLGMEIDPAPARRFDWVAIKCHYDAGHNLRECQAKFGFSKSAWSSAVVRGVITPRPRAMPIAELLAAPRVRDHIKHRLLDAGLLPRRCESCGISEWRGRPLSLELHHANGDGSDNRLENLQILCPNCHSQTASWGGRNGKRRRRTD